MRKLLHNTLVKETMWLKANRTGRTWNELKKSFLEIWLMNDVWSIAHLQPCLVQCSFISMTWIEDRKYMYSICRGYKTWKDKEQAGWQYASIVSQRRCDRLEMGQPDKMEFNKDKCRSIQQQKKKRKEKSCYSKHRLGEMCEAWAWEKIEEMRTENLVKFMASLPSVNSVKTVIRDLLFGVKRWKDKVQIWLVLD